MSRILLSTIWLFILLAACAPSSHHSDSSPVTATRSNQEINQANPAMRTDPVVIDTLITGSPDSLTDLPVSQHGEIILSEGFYESEFKSYCLQPGTPSPSDRDAYLQAPLNGHRKDIVETALRNSIDKPYLDQKNIQLLLWSVVSVSNYNKLSPQVRSTADQLLTPRQIFQLKGGYAGLVKDVAAFIPESNVKGIYNQMNNLFELGASSYEAYERIAVPGGNSVIHHPGYKKDQWYKQPGGYFVRYFPSGYKKVKVQVYVPKGSLDSTGKRNGKYILLDPVTMMAIPANSNAQRLGIGAPVIEIVRKIIQIESQMPRSNPKKPGSPPQPPRPSNPKTTI
ncbi:hypothetical protein [Flavihumibacter petaseus]|uniref:Uncharacterized protein n=1 Tax=Flavihumibacter petaseus NBRC 106054 TaxID=1220578 RepID=A0A0E9N7M4_9BACT|nr:hypothetical protein [Flavihumibacter petaseus]GAO45716.1 hypothetical protein FPE01S_08_00360 [Flavihumibacter petaseus NBRC 106054]